MRKKYLVAVFILNCLLPLAWFMWERCHFGGRDTWSDVFGLVVAWIAVSGFLYGGWAMGLAFGLQFAVKPQDVVAGRVPGLHIFANSLVWPTAIFPLMFLLCELDAYDLIDFQLTTMTEFRPLIYSIYAHAFYGVVVLAGLIIGLGARQDPPKVDGAPSGGE